MHWQASLHLDFFRTIVLTMKMYLFFSPALHYIFDEEGLLIQRERYWQWSHVLDLTRSYDETVAEFAFLFNTVMQESLADGRVAIPLSGGLDSRSSVAPIVGGEVEAYWSYSYGYSNASVETKIARQVAQTRSLSFDSFIIRPYLFDNLERILAWTEGFQDIIQSRQAFVRDEISQHFDSTKIRKRKFGCLT